MLKILSRILGSGSSRSHSQYSALAVHDEDGALLDPSKEGYDDTEPSKARSKRVVRVLPFHRLWTKNVLFTLLAQAFFDFQMGLVFLAFASPSLQNANPSIPVHSTTYGSFSSRRLATMPMTRQAPVERFLLSLLEDWACLLRV